MESHTAAHTGVQCHNLSSLQPLPLSSRDFPASVFQVAGITVETRFHYVGQAGLKLLTSLYTSFGLPKCWDYRVALLLPKLEYNGTIAAHLNLRLPIETGFLHVGQAVLKLPTSGLTKAVGGPAWAKANRDMAPEGTIDKLGVIMDQAGLGWEERILRGRIESAGEKRNF
ncbi:hypothetical protein AAY473_033515 [Plecturocebus cupreus]